MRRIDLTALIVSPMVVGALMTYGGSVLAVLVICVWNLLAWAPECALLRYSIQQAPWLACVLAPLPTFSFAARSLQVSSIILSIQRPVNLFQLRFSEVVTSCAQRQRSRVHYAHIEKVSSQIYPTFFRMAGSL